MFLSRVTRVWNVCIWFMQLLLQRRAIRGFLSGLTANTASIQFGSFLRFFLLTWLRSHVALRSLNVMHDWWKFVVTGGSFIGRQLEWFFSLRCTCGIVPAIVLDWGSSLSCGGQLDDWAVVRWGTANRIVVSVMDGSGCVLSASTYSRTWWLCFVQEELCYVRRKVGGHLTVSWRTACSIFDSCSCRGWYDVTCVSRCDHTALFSIIWPTSAPRLVRQR